MNVRGSDFPPNLGKSNLWKRGGRLLWCSPKPPPGPEEPLEEWSFWKPSTLGWMTLVVRARMRLGSSSMVVSSPMAVAAEWGGGGSGAEDEVEERLEADIRLSRVSTPKTAAPWLRSS